MERPEKLVVLTGAGMSAESGIPTFRGDGGLWEGQRVQDVATPEAWAADPDRVRRFYNERRKHLMACEPNAGHRIIARWESHCAVHVITQNVDDLHERAGSTDVLHLHGELMKARSLDATATAWDMAHWEMQSSDRCPNGFHVRPHIVWFGEEVPNMDRAISIIQSVDCLLIVGTSLQVYPAAQLAYIARPGIPVHVVDPSSAELPLESAHCWPLAASEGLARLDAQWFS